MALIIKAQRPKGCEWTDKTSRTGMGYCPLKDKCMAYRNEVSKQYTINAHPIDYFPSDCPIIGEIPDRHGDLIERNALPIQGITDYNLESHTVVEFEDVLNAPVIVEASNGTDD